MLFSTRSILKLNQNKKITLIDYIENAEVGVSTHPNLLHLDSQALLPAAIARFWPEVENEGIQEGSPTGDPHANSTESIDEQSTCNRHRQEECEIFVLADEIKPAAVRILLPFSLFSMTQVNAKNKRKQTKNSENAVK